MQACICEQNQPANCYYPVRADGENVREIY